MDNGFEEWWMGKLETGDLKFVSQYDAAKAAYDYQQKRIDDLEGALEAHRKRWSSQGWP